MMMHFFFWISHILGDYKASTAYSSSIDRLDRLETIEQYAMLRINVIKQ